MSTMTHNDEYGDPQPFTVESRPTRIARYMQAPLLDFDSAAEVLSLSRAYLENIMAGKTPLPKPQCVRIGRRVMFRPDDLRAWADTLAAQGKASS